MDSLGEEYTSLVEQITSMQEALNARHTTPPSPAVLNQLGFAPEIAKAMYSAGSPPAGIFGVGVAGFNGTPRPVVFVMRDMIAGPVEMPTAAEPDTPGEPDTPVRKMLNHLQAPRPADLVVVGLPRSGTSRRGCRQVPRSAWIPSAAHWASGSLSPVADPGTSRLGTRHPRSARSSPSMDNPSAPY